MFDMYSPRIIILIDEEGKKDKPNAVLVTAGYCSVNNNLFSSTKKKKPKRNVWNKA